MEFRFVKFAMIVFKKGKLLHSQKLLLYINIGIQELWEYLETEESERKIEEGMHQKIKNDTEIRVEWKE